MNLSTPAFLDGKNSRLHGLKQVLSSRKLLTSYFVAVTALMLFQHSMGWNWDFSVYSLNAQYLFQDGIYMEWLRPPMVPAILGLLQFVFPTALSEYVYIVLTSTFFLYSCKRLCDSHDLDLTPVYILFFSPVAVFFASLNGSELLFTCFLALFLADFRESKAGLWMALAILTRYTGFILLPLALLQRKPSKIVKTFILSFVVVLPWLAFNYFTLGHPLASVASNFALNSVERGISEVFNPINLFVMTGIASLGTLNYLKDVEFSFQDRILLALSALIILRQFATGMKEIRYLFDLSIPVALLGWKGFRELDIDLERSLVLLAGIYLIVSAAGIAIYTANHSPEFYSQVASDTGDCLTVSNQWAQLSYTGTPTGPMDFRTEEQYLEADYKIVSFEEGNYTIRGDECREGKFNSTYVERLHRAHDKAQYCQYTVIDTCWLEDIVGIDTGP